MQRRVLECVVLLASLYPAEPIRAVDYFWQNSSGGAFTESSNWLPSVPPLVRGPGGPLDTVNFDLGTASTSPYLITDVAGQNDQLIVHNDSLELSIFPSYTLLNTSSANPSLVIGAANGDTATLTLSGSSTSMLTTEVTRIGNAAATTATVTAKGLQWNGENLRVGHVDDADGTLNVEEAAAVTTTNLSIGHLDGSLGEVRVNDGTLTTTGNFLIGREGNGSLRIGTNGVVTSASAFIASEPTGEGQVNVFGQFAIWTIQDTLTVGGVGDGQLSISSGSLTNADAVIGDLPASDGFVSVSGGEWTTAGRLSIGGPTIGGTSGGSGLVRLSGGEINVGEEITISPNGVLELQHGVLSAEAITPEGTGQFNWTGGSYFAREFNGNLVNQGGSLVPDFQAVINGNYTQQAQGSLSTFITGAAASNLYRSVDITGSANLSGILSLQVNTLYDPSPTEVYTILESSNLTGAFSNAASGQRLTEGNGSGSFIVYYGPGSPFNANHVVLASFLPAGVPGDFNANGVVDAADYVMWRNSAGTMSSLPNDGGIGGTIGAAHYNLWRTNFGHIAGSAAGASATAAVPESAASLQMILAIGVLATWRRRSASSMSKLTSA
jgi:T5SS/PEP-CTERM-associated repeat protein